MLVPPFYQCGDWRRYNVDLFIEQLGKSIHKTKPWVKFGVSPFGIYRNKKSDPLNGSETNGLQNYDDLYADVLRWVNNGWKRLQGSYLLGYSASHSART